MLDGKRCTISYVVHCSCCFIFIFLCCFSIVLLHKEKKFQSTELRDRFIYDNVEWIEQ